MDSNVSAIRLLSSRPTSEIIKCRLRRASEIGKQDGSRDSVSFAKIDYFGGFGLWDGYLYEVIPSARLDIVAEACWTCERHAPLIFLSQ